MVALEDNTQVLIQKPDEEVFGLPSATASPEDGSNVLTFNLNALESVRYLRVSEYHADYYYSGLIGLIGINTIGLLRQTDLFTVSACFAFFALHQICVRENFVSLLKMSIYVC